MNEKDVGRRTFLNWLIGGTTLASLAAIFYPAARFFEPQEVPEAAISSIKVGVIEDFPPDSGSIFKFGRKPGILIHTADGKFKAFHATCTHLSCIVQYRKDLGAIYCACHNGRFNTNGENISGPPPRPLEEFDVHLKGNEIYVSVRS
ncbi:MAG: ubiquinol-cytochrome c reductase iron-sulfur subunit [candidate division Zixibacteria bacterium]|nr:ubiquinol-cytochrome c reductase iron-sulfur subunit [candidate division Zixibacteria bacterium]MBU1469142.1 ubiquinol-cytochrome c reductase iron-sulfur subunit [candidate division Zixibacteria bacterium]MBU2624858.1 ubiquinol-cytochrome c reductase iron-sulfur subunit [candidate division Zixibacteria bacterium]